MNSYPLKNDLPPTLSITEGIRKVGIGKKGSLSLPAELGLKIEQELCDPIIREKHQLIIGGFLAGLLQKGIAKGWSTDEEKIFQTLKVNPNQPQSVVQFILSLSKENQSSTSLFAVQGESIRPLLLLLASNRELTETQAEQLGNFLFAPDHFNEAAKGFAVATLRLRYESSAEWRGLANSALKYTQHFDLDTDKKIILFSDPFNGFTYCHHLSPLVGYELQKQHHYTVVHSIGRNSGPKYNGNLLEIQQRMNLPVLKKMGDKAITPFGAFVLQSDLNPNFDRWVERRRRLIKRPFFATLEKFLPAVKDVFLFVSSAFHPPYYEKMIDLAEHIGYKNIIIQKLGLEGGIGVALQRKTKYMACQRQQNGTYIRREWVFDPTKYLTTKEIETYKTIPKKIISIEDQIVQFNHYLQGKPIDPILEKRVQLTTSFFQNIIRNLCKET